MMDRAANAYVVRTSPEAAADIFVQLQAGSARMGWSYSHELNLTDIMAAAVTNWESLQTYQQDAWKCHGFVDRARVGDLLLYSNVPAQGVFCVVEITGDYLFTSEAESIHGDFRSARPCILRTPEPIARTDNIVFANLRNKLGLQQRFYQIYDCDADIEHLLSNLHDASKEVSSRTGAFSRMMEPIHREMAQHWSRHFPKASLSRFIAETLQSHGHAVQLREGPSEHGSDLVIELQSEFLADPIVIGVQVGSYDGDVGWGIVRQKLEQLLSGWEENGLSFGALVLSGNWTQEAKDMLAEHNKIHSHKVKAIDGLQLAQIVTRTTGITT